MLLYFYSKFSNQCNLAEYIPEKEGKDHPLDPVQNSYRKEAVK